MGQRNAEQNRGAQAANNEEKNVCKVMSYKPCILYCTELRDLNFIEKNKTKFVGQSPSN